jgi:nitroimidazol reductase NimA-like FMN-containing flavoprotein (pyridoxamine 5'-phosphate oxidase superfamily)
VTKPARIPETLRAFLAHHRTMVLATEADGQPSCTRVFFAEVYEASDLPTLYALVKSPSRKLVNLQANPRVGVFIGPEQPTSWLEAHGRAAVLEDTRARERALALVLAKAPEAGPFLARVIADPTRIDLSWLRLTDVTAEPRAVIELPDSHPLRS